MKYDHFFYPINPLFLRKSCIPVNLTSDTPYNLKVIFITVDNNLLYENQDIFMKYHITACIM